MKTIKILTAVLAMATMGNGANAQTGDKRVLVAWYSWGGNTETVGKYIQEITGADVFIIEPATAYSRNYNECVDQAKAEINAGRQRAIKGSVGNIAEYDIVIVGTPNWWSTMAPPVLSFITEHNLSKKTIVPFVTHGGGREARCLTDMQKAIPGATFEKGFAVSGGRAKNSKADVEKWLREIGVVK